MGNVVMTCQTAIATAIVARNRNARFMAPSPPCCSGELSRPRVLAYTSIGIASFMCLALALRKPPADNEDGRMVRQDYSCPGSCLPQPRQDPDLLSLQLGRSIRGLAHPPRRPTTAGQ